jgi:hypothetical protein
LEGVFFFVREGEVREGEGGTMRVPSPAAGMMTTTFIEGVSV